MRRSAYPGESFPKDLAWNPTICPNTYQPMMAGMSPPQIAPANPYRSPAASPAASQAARPGSSARENAVVRVMAWVVSASRHQAKSWAFWPSPVVVGWLVRWWAR